MKQENRKIQDVKRGLTLCISQFAFLLLASCFLLPVAAASSPTITSIAIKGNTVTPTETVQASIKSKVGSPFDRELLAKDIKSLWELGQFMDVKIEKKEMPGGIELTYIVEERPNIIKIEFKGNKKIKKDELSKDITIRLFNPLDGKELSESIAKIKEAYNKKGYYLVDVDYSLEHKEANDFELILKINEHYKAIVRRVDFIGNHVFSDKELRKVVKTKQKTAFSFISGSGKLKEDQLEQDVMLLTFHYLNYGYLKVKVTSPRVAISKDKQYIFVTFTVEEGKQYRVDSVDVGGEILTTPEELRSMLKTKSKMIYSQKVVEEDIQRLTDLYGNMGYAFAHIRPETIPDDETLTADITFQIEKGERIVIEKINIFGNTVTRDKVIRRELKVKEGDIYNEAMIRESKQKLMQLGFFEEVNFATPRGSKDNTLILNIVVKEKPTGTFNIGAGFSTVENYILSASIAKENFFGYGIGGQISAELSSIRQQFMLQFRDPYFLDSEWMLSTSVFRLVYRYTDFDRESYGGDISIGHRIFDNSSISVGYQAESVEVTDFSFAVPELFRQDAEGLTSKLMLTLARDTRDNRLFPSKGMYHTVENEFSGSKLGGDNDFYRVEGNSRFYIPVIWGIVGKMNGRIGYVRTLGDRPVPLFERYFTGGPYSLRGFWPRSIGPRLMIPSGPTGADTEFVYGGNKQLVFNGELEFPIYNPAGFKGVFFVDAGNAFAEDENYSLKNLRSNWGLGLRWNSPLGPLRFEWGVPFTRRPGEDSVVFNFTIGSPF